MEKKSKIQSYYATNTKQKGIQEAHRWKKVQMKNQLITNKILNPPDFMIKICETDYPTSKYYIH